MTTKFTLEQRPVRLFDVPKPEAKPKPRKYDAFHPAPVSWWGSIGAMVCDVCGVRFTGRRQSGDRGSFPMRNRARGLALRHVNEKHGVEQIEEKTRR